MEPSNDIAVELSALSAPVAQMMGGLGRRMPYSVPEGYFEQFPDLVSCRIAAGSGTFEVPAGYFDGLASQIITRIKANERSKEKPEAVDSDIRAELAGISAVVAGIGRHMPYHLPEGYFDAQSPVLAVLKQTSAYRVPEAYFDHLSPVLTVARELDGYQVPEGYFDSFPATVTARIAAGVSDTGSAGADPLGGRVIAIGSRPKTPTQQFWARWKYVSAAAVAACVLLVFGLPQLRQHVGGNHPASADIEQNLQKVSDQELMAYLDDQHTFVADPVTDGGATMDMNEGNIKSFLGNVSDSALQQYVEEHGKEEDMATN
ncbi:MAG TPA: hypothetical protein VN616_14080 [Puia sp.]|nr:hypothetical protein [Puia sp.]